MQEHALRYRQACVSRRLPPQPHVSLLQVQEQKVALEAHVQMLEVELSAQRDAAGTQFAPVSAESAVAKAPTNPAWSTTCVRRDALNAATTLLIDNFGDVKVGGLAGVQAASLNASTRYPPSPDRPALSHLRSQAGPECRPLHLPRQWQLKSVWVHLEARFTRAVDSAVPPIRTMCPFLVGLQSMQWLRCAARGVMPLA